MSKCKHLPIGSGATLIKRVVYPPDEIQVFAQMLGSYFEKKKNSSMTI
jgi:hypothetical protein